MVCVTSLSSSYVIQSIFISSILAKEPSTWLTIHQAMESCTETNRSHNGATILCSTRGSAISHRSEQNGRLHLMVTQIKQRYVHVFETLECIRCQFILYAAMILSQLWILDQLKQSITIGIRPRMTPVGCQQYVYQVSFLVGQLKQTLTCESRMRIICRTACGIVNFWVQKYSSILREYYAAAVADLDVAPGPTSSFPPMLGDAEEELEIAQDMADKEDCANYLARWGGKASHNLTVEDMPGRKWCIQYIISRRMRDRWCQDEDLWRDEQYPQRTPENNSIRGKEWWDQRMQSAN